MSQRFPGAGAQGAGAGAQASQRGFFTHTVYSWFTETHFLTQVGTISVTQ